VRTLLHRVAVGRWDAVLKPTEMNARAAALGPAYNLLVVSSKKVVPAQSAFLSYRPAPYLRPYNQPAR
jgi:hypothetical protein